MSLFNVLRGIKEPLHEDATPLEMALWEAAPAAPDNQRVYDLAAKITTELTKLGYEVRRI